MGLILLEHVPEPFFLQVSTFLPWLHLQPNFPHKGTREEEW